MTQPRFQKNLPAPLRLLLRPWVIVSVGLHIVVLLLPLPDRSTPEPPLAEEPVRITQLPASPLPTAPPSVTVPTPAVPPPVAQTSPAAPPPAAPRPTAPPPASPSPSAQASPGSTVQPSPTPASQSPSPQGTSNSEEPDPSPSPTPSLSPTPETSEVTGLATKIPHATIGGEPGCGGQENCWQTQDTQWRSVARALEQELENQGYDVEQQTDDETPGFRVYEVSRNGEVEYLNLISTLQGTFYVLADEAMSREQLEQLTEASNS